MHILFISQYFHPEIGAASERITGQAIYLSKLGYKVTAITGFPNYPSEKFYPGYRKRLCKIQRYKGVKIIRVWLLTTIGKGPFKRLLNYLSFMVASISAGICAKRPDYIIATSGPIFAGVVGYVLSCIKKKPFYLDVRDIWPERIYAGTTIKKYSILQLAGRLAGEARLQAAKIITVTKGVKNNIVSKGINQRKIKVITNGVDINVFVKRKVDRALVRKLGVGEKDFIVIYTGTLGLLQDIELMIDCARQLKTYKDIIFLIIGNGVKKNELISKIKFHKLKNVKILSSVQPDKLSEYINLSNIGINTNTDNNHNKMAIPVKMFTYMACGKPVVLANDGEVSELVEKYDFGKCVTLGDLESFCNAIIEYYKDKQLCDVCGENGYKLVTEKFSSERLANKLVKTM